MDFWAIFLLASEWVIAVASLLWFISAIISDTSIVDIFWGSAFVISSTVAYVYGDHPSTTKTLIYALVFIWGVRLTLYIGFRNLGHGEDYRYQAFRKSFGPNYWWISFFVVFLFQAILNLIIVSPLLNVIASEDSKNFSIFHTLGLMIWCIGFYFEAVGDYQLSKFKSNPNNKGKIMDKGLWGITRHPNYFGDSVVWWSFFIMNLSTSNGIYFIFSPIMMTFLLMRVSGVSLLERSLKKTKPGYAEYCQRTPSFFPKLF